jgi:hypothetical protein
MSMNASTSSTRSRLEKEAILKRIESLEPSEAKMILVMAFEWMTGDNAISTSMGLEDWLDEANLQDDAMSTMYCPTHGKVEVPTATESSFDKCPTCEHALSFDETEAKRYAEQDGESDDVPNTRCPNAGNA